MEKINDKFYADLGKVVFLWGRSRLHRSWQTHLTEQYVQPALVLKQYLILEDQAGIPVAYISWACLSLEAEAKYLENPHALVLSDWNSGERIWFTDLVSPFDSKYTLEILRHLRVLFKNTVARSVRIKPGASSSKVAFYWGDGVSPDRRKELRNYYYKTARNTAKSTKIIWEKG